MRGQNTTSRGTGKIKNDKGGKKQMKKENLDLTKLKVGQVIDRDKINLGMIGNLCKGNPKVIAIKFEFYEGVAGFHTELALKVNDYEKIMEDINEQD